MTGTLVVLATLVGGAVGSFLNVVVWRVPRGRSVVSPPSACPNCGHPIRWFDNLPVVSWMLLRARCRDCGAPISIRYPLVEAATAVAFGAAAWWTGPTWVLPAVLYLVAVSIALALIDLDVRRLPDAIVLPSYPIAAVLLILASADPGGSPRWDALVRAAIGAAAMLAIYLVPRLLVPHGMGLGDVKLAGVLGLYLGWFGWGALFVGWFAAYLLGGLFSLGLMVAGRAGRRSAIPFGPWMLIGAFIGLLAGERIAHAYLSAL